MKKLMSIIIVLLFILSGCSSDKIPPVVEIVGPSTVELDFGEKYVEEGVTASDDMDGELEVTISDNINYLSKGEYEIVYTAEDEAGNVTEITRKVIVNPLVIECDNDVTTIINAIETDITSLRDNVVLTFDITFINNSADTLEVAPAFWFESNVTDAETLYLNIAQLFSIDRLESGASITDKLDFAYEGEQIDLIDSDRIEFGFSHEGIIEGRPYVIDLNIADYMDLPN